MIEKVNRLYRIWCNMRYRCNKTYTDHYARYGGRGIKVCAEWDNLNDGFKNFEAWAKEHGYEDSLTIDRIDNNGNYEPDNCRWVDRKTNTRNRSVSRMLTYNGETLHIVEMAEKYGIPVTTVMGRYQNGWSAEKILLTPVKKNKERTVLFNGKNVSLRELSALTGVNLNTIKTRYRNGCTVEEILSPDYLSDKFKKVFLKIDKDSGKILGRYKGSFEALRSVNGKARSRIIECCNGTAKTAYGYKWKYE